METLPSIESKGQGANAYIKLVDYLCDLLECHEHNTPLDIQQVAYRRSYLHAKRVNASQIHKSIQKNELPDRQDRQEDRANLAENESEMAIPVPEMEKLMVIYRESEYRRKMYEELKDMEGAICTNKISNIGIRNFLMLEILFECGGMRSDVITNMTLGEFFQNKAIGDSDRHVILVKDHKTKQHKGSAQVIIPRSLKNLLVQYATKVRKTFCEIEDPVNSLMFVAQDSGNKIAKLSCAAELFKEKTGAKYHVTPRDFRYYYAHLGQASEDPVLNEQFPEYIGHCKATAQRTYIKKDAKIRAHAQFLDKLQSGASTSQSLPDVEDQENEEEERAKIIQAKRAMREEEVKTKEERHIPGKRRAFSDQERALIKSTFKSVPQTNLKRGEFDAAIRENQEFAEFVTRHENEGKPLTKVFTQVTNSFHSMRR